MKRKPSRAKRKPAPVKRKVGRPATAATVKHTLQSWAVELKMDRKTLETRLRAIDFEWSAGEEISARVVFEALLGSKETEEIRGKRLDNEEKERQAAVEVGTLFPMAELEPWIVERYIIPMSNIFSGMGAAIDTRCNPQHPEVARRAIEDYIESAVKPALKQGLEKPRRKEGK